MTNEAFIVRAGFRSTAIGAAGSAIVDIAGFSRADCEDCIALLEMTIRKIQRQMWATDLGFELTPAEPRKHEGEVKP